MIYYGIAMRVVEVHRFLVNVIYLISFGKFNLVTVGVLAHPVLYVNLNLMLSKYRISWSHFIRGLQGSREIARGTRNFSRTL